MSKSRLVPDLGPWPARLTWLVLPITVGPSLSEALNGRSVDVRWVMAATVWLAWTLTLVALLVPRTASLTTLRIIAPVALAAAIWATSAGQSVGITDVVALATATLAIGAAFSPVTGDVFVDGSSYGSERRMALRVPSALLLGPLPLTWLVGVTSAAAGPLLLAAHRWVAGVVALAIGAPAAWFAVRSLHQLARRWVVFVPAGLVLHDPAGLSEPALFVRRSVRLLGPAPAASQAFDLTQGAFGLALQLDLTEPVDLTVSRGRSAAETVAVEALLFTPTRPGSLLAEARSRRIPVGSAQG